MRAEESRQALGWTECDSVPGIVKPFTGMYYFPRLFIAAVATMFIEIRSKGAREPRKAERSHDHPSVSGSDG